MSESVPATVSTTTIASASSCTHGASARRRSDGNRPRAISSPPTIAGTTRQQRRQPADGVTAAERGAARLQALDQPGHAEAGQRRQGDEERDRQPERIEQRVVDAVGMHERGAAQRRRDGGEGHQPSALRQEAAGERVQEAEDDAAHGVDERQVQRAAERDAADLEPVVGLDPDHVVGAGQTQHEHGEAAQYAAHHEPADGAGRDADRGVAKRASDVLAEGRQGSGGGICSGHGDSQMRLRPTVKRQPLRQSRASAGTSSSRPSMRIAARPTSGQSACRWPHGPRRRCTATMPASAAGTTSLSTRSPT